MAETKGVVQYEVEVQKKQKKRMLDLRISLIRGPRGKTKMLGEAYTKTSDQPAIYFKVINCSKEEEVYDQFLRLLVHRGFLPLKVRPVKEDRPQEWAPVPFEDIEGVEDVLRQEAKFEA